MALTYSSIYTSGWGRSSQCAVPPLGMAQISNGLTRKRIIEDTMREMRSLRDISLNRSAEQFTVWGNLAIVKKNNLTGSMTSQEVLVSELKMSLALVEVVYNMELSDLLAVARRAVRWNDALPKFNRRHLVMLITRLKKYSDHMCHDIERDWHTERSIALNLDKLYDFLDFNINTSYALSCVAYCEILDELRGMLKRAMLKSSDEIRTVFSPRLNAERALLPLQRLSLHRSSLRKILAELPARSYDSIRCQTTLDNVTAVLDRCYEVLSSLHGNNYVADVDNMLDFSSKLSSLKFRKQKLDNSDLKIPSDEIAMDYIKNRVEENHLSQMKNEIMRLTSLTVEIEKSESSFNLIDLMSEKDYSLDSELALENSAESNGHEDAYEFIDVPLENSYIVDNEISSNSILQKSFDEGPLYQAYIPQDLGDTYEECGTYSNPYEEEHIYEEINLKSAVQYPRTLWCELSSVKRSGKLEKLTIKERALQEAKFEIITSEVSYLKSLCVLITLFYESTDIRNVLTHEDMETMFANISEVREISERFLYDLAGHLEEDLMLTGISSLVRRHAVSSFRVYIDYCTNQMNLYQNLQRLTSQYDDFQDLVVNIEKYPECQGYSLASFLTLPMQRVTRLPLLMQAVQKRLKVSSTEFTSCQLALSALNQLVYDCNEGKRRESLTTNNRRSEYLKV